MMDDEAEHIEDALHACRGHFANVISGLVRTGMGVDSTSGLSDVDRMRSVIRHARLHLDSAEKSLPTTTEAP